MEKKLLKSVEPTVQSRDGETDGCTERLYHYRALYSLTWFSIVRCSAVDVSSPRSSALLYVASQCFHVPGVPTFRLWCPPAPDGRPQLVRVIQAFYGVPPWNTTCGYRSSAGHCVQLADLPPRVQCSGRYHCTIHVSNPYLMSCRAYAVYMQVNYTCIPSKQY